MKALTLFTRAQCHLCEEAHAALERVRREEPFSLGVVDLDRDATEAQRVAYAEQVPVVELDGRKIMKFRVDERRLLRLLRA